MLNPNPNPLLKEVLSKHKAGPIMANFTPRELEVIGLVKRAKTNKEIAYQLGITANTVEIHMSNIYRKAEIHRRAELMLLPIQEAKSATKSTVNK